MKDRQQKYSPRELNTDTDTTIQTYNRGILVKYHDILAAGGEHFLGIMFLTIK